MQTEKVGQKYKNRLPFCNLKTEHLSSESLSIVLYVENETGNQPHRMLVPTNSFLGCRAICYAKS